MLLKKHKMFVTELAKDNPEVLVLQAMIHTAWIVYDPMTNGQKIIGRCDVYFE